MAESPLHQDNHDEDYYVPLTDQRVFGAGLKRKRIAFVPASNTESSLPVPVPTKSLDAGAKYLSIVLGQQNASPSVSSTRHAAAEPVSLPISPAPLDDDLEAKTRLCRVCNMPVGLTPTTHESSIAHQLCLAHSHPPSHLDRERKGLKYLQEYGWDPDSRVGLGARSEGIRVPVKAREKRDTTGLGLQDDEDDGAEDGHTDAWVKRKVKTKTGAKRDQTRVIKLNAQEVRKIENEKKKKAEILRSSFYGEDLSQYLGPGG